MEWKNEIQPAEPRVVARLDNDIRLSVQRANRDDNSVWSHFSLCFGRHVPVSPNDAMATWPREAIAMAREKLDDLERHLDEEADE